MLIVALCATNCKTTRETIRKENDHLREVTKMVADSVVVYRSDSVFIRERGDTVLIDRYHTLYRYRQSTDTLVVRDSVYVNRDVKVTETVEVNRLTGGQQFLLWCGRIFIGIGVLLIVYMVIKLRLKN